MPALFLDPDDVSQNRGNIQIASGVVKTMIDGEDFSF